MSKLNITLDMLLLGISDNPLDEDSTNIDREWLDADLVDEENEDEPLPLDDWEELDLDDLDEEDDVTWSEMSYNRGNKDHIVYGEL
jgi:hypothetical protein